MANHVARSTPQPVPVAETPTINWVAMVRMGDEYAIATMTTRGSKIIEQHIGKPNPWRVEVECQIQNWVLDNVVNREA